jgi:hypothetical protein
MDRLNVLLAKTDHLAKTFKGMVSDYLKFFNKSQGAFNGEKRTYTTREGVIDQPNQRSMKKVQTTVEEKLIWFMEQAGKYVDAAFSVERTNAMGIMATLTVDGKAWGEFTSLELLRLKSIIENGELHQMIASIPVRSDAEVWHPTIDPDYQDRNVWESPLLEGVSKTGLKEDYILLDPNIKGDNKNYTPQVSQKNSVLELGDYTHQRFTGETSQRARAIMLERRDNLLVAVIETLKRCNEAEAQQSELNAKRVFGYIFDVK